MFNGLPKPRFGAVWFGLNRKSINRRQLYVADVAHRADITDVADIAHRADLTI
jgi:hypothetical protein